MLIPRQIESAIRDLHSKYPILAITGPRQSGKTTLLKSLFTDWIYVSLENPDNGRKSYFSFSFFALIKS